MTAAVDPATGRTTELLRETDTAWLNIDRRMPRWLADGSGFVWTTERRGGWEIELRAADGAFRKVVVPQEVGYIEFVSMDKEAQKLYFLSGKYPPETHLYAVNFDGTELSQISTEPGMHAAVFAKDHSIYVLTSSSLSGMPRSYVYKADGSLFGELPSAGEDPPFVPNVELLTVGDGRPYHAAVTRPRNFNPDLTYPVIMYVYGGPHVNVITSTMARYLMDQWIADHGFVVVSGDGRGTPRRGRDFERIINGSFGTIPLEDQITILQLLGERYNEVDLERVGVFGWSFGGYLSALAVLRRPDVFKVGVAGAPVADFRDYDTHYTERYLGLPSENKEGYDETSLLTYAQNLSRPLLIIHGTADDNVYFFNALKLVDALFRSGKSFEFIPLSGFTHMVPDPAVRERLNSKIVEFLAKHLWSK